MQANETLSYQGYQVCLFPLDYIYVTQRSPDPYSHCCGYPIDLAGQYAGYPIYAPCDCHLVYSDSWAAGNTRAYTSDDRVWTPAGLMYVTFSFTHDDNPPARTSFSQGELIGHTGGAGGFPDHLHLDQADIPNAQLIYYGYTCPGYGNPCYALNDSVPPEDIFYLSGSETIVITLGIDFETWDQPPEPPTPTGSNGALFTIMSRYVRRRLNNVKRIIRS